jgi:peptide/nickel transport system ATP-binding protein
MYAGRLVEGAETRALFARPLHPYTRGLLASVPSLSGDPDARLAAIAGQPPDLSALPPGCAFAPRCPLVVERCTREEPPLAPLERAADRRSACFEAERLLSPAEARG